METSENRIAEVRNQKGLKQVELANLLAISRGQLANLEAGTRKVDLPELRRIARKLDCSVMDLLLPQDAPDRPTEAEAAMLAELRAAPDYDARAILIAARGVLATTRSIRALETAPQNLAGDPILASELATRWDRLDDPGRKKALQLLDTAREFSR